jgi:hypothetical protein
MPKAHESYASFIRWHANIHYRTKKGTFNQECDLEELEDLHSIVERGPHWDTIEKIEIFRVNHVTDKKLTVERSYVI